MYKKKEIKIWIVALLFISLIAVPIYAADCQSKTMSGQEQMSTKTSSNQSMIFKSKDLIGSDVKSLVSEKHQTIGKVKNLIIDENQNKVQYVIVSSGFKDHPVPWSAFDVSGGQVTSTDANDANVPSTKTKWYSLRKNTVLSLNMTKDQFKQSPIVKSTSIKYLNDQALQQRIDSFYSQYPSGTQTSSTRYGFNENASLNLAKASTINGCKLENTSGSRLGRVKDMVIDRNGQINYSLVGFGGFLRIGEKTAAVPWTAVSLQSQRSIAKVDATKQTLQSSIVKRNSLAQLSQPQFASQINQNYTQPGGTVSAFVPGEERQTSMSAWQANSEYNKNFDPTRMTTIEGTIKSVDTFYPESNAAPGTLLIVETKEGQSVTVQAGPSTFAMHKKIQFKPGSDIKVTGSQTTVNENEVVMASQIRTEGKSLKLRDSHGKPLWSVKQQMQQEMKNTKY